MALSPEVHALSVMQFCGAYNFSKAFFYKLLKQGKGPKTFKVGRRTLISVAAAEQWQQGREHNGA